MRKVSGPQVRPGLSFKKGGTHVPNVAPPQGPMPPRLSVNAAALRATSHAVMLCLCWRLLTRATENVERDVTGASQERGLSRAVIGYRHQRACASRRVGEPSGEQDMIQPGAGSRSPAQKGILLVQRSIRRTAGRSRIQ
jgi:hypothetical protein